MLEVGLTGGIGSGKSTVGALLVASGATLIDADAIVRELQEPGAPVFVSMVEHFGDRIVAEDGTLNRQAVADVVFSDAAELEALNKIVHPGVNKEMTARRRALVDTDTTVILDIPLLVESGHKDLGGIIVVDTPVDMAIARLMEHRGFSEEDARNRISNQVSREERAEKADFLVDNGGSLVELEAEVERCWTWIETLDRPEPGTWVEPMASRYANNDPNTDTNTEATDEAQE